jgi:5-methylcytosine-specific restriction enzyme A
MSRGNRLEQVVWDEFAHEPERLRRVAAAIANGVGSPDAEIQDAPDEEEEEFAEGRVAFRLHRARERNPKLAAMKKRQALALHGRLACAVCGFDFAERYGPRGEGFIECHHTIAVSDPTHTGTTRLEDVALVCSNCHRIIHRSRPWLALPALSTLLVAGPGASVVR